MTKNNPQTTNKLRVIKGDVYTQLMDDGFWHLGCKCNVFRTAGAGNLPYCQHIIELVGKHEDQERLGFNVTGVENDIHITLRAQKPYIDTLVRVADSDGRGMRRCAISSVLQALAVDVDF